jgi:uncharacterized repeat protein (TIGR03803 family)
MDIAMGLDAKAPLISAAIVFGLSASAAASTPVFSILTTLPGHPTLGLVIGSTIYGTDPNGGTGAGTLFSLTESGTYTLLHTFVAPTEGYQANGLLALGQKGSVWGTTTTSGPNGGGTLFNYSTSGLKVMHAFGASGDGSGPLQGPVGDAAGTIYGTTSGGAISTNGNLFSYASNGAYTQMHDFLSGTDGHCPFSGIVHNIAGTIYGTTVGHGFGGNPNGSIWKFIGSTLTTLYVFADGNDGEWPDQAPTLDLQGNLYGTTHIKNGVGFAGAIWKISTKGVFSVMYDLKGSTDGSGPNSPLVLNSDGFLYGTTSAGGSAGLGTVFRISLAGHFEVIHTFTNKGDGYTPTGSLARDRSSNIFGGTAGGTVYKITP